LKNIFKKITIPLVYVIFITNIITELLK